MRLSTLVAGLLAASLTTAAASDIGDGTVSTFVSWAELHSSNPGGSTTAQYGYFYRGTIPVDGAAKFSGALVSGPSLVPITYLPGRWEPIELQPTYYSSSNLVYTRIYKYRNAAGTIINGGGTATAPGLKDGIIPRLEGVLDNGDGTLTATFGYTGNFNAGITYPISSTINELDLSGTGYISSEAQKPEIFKPGIRAGVFQVTFDATDTITWTVDNKLVTASAANLTAPG